MHSFCVHGFIDYVRAKIGETSISLYEEDEQNKNCKNSSYSIH